MRTSFAVVSLLRTDTKVNIFPSGSQEARQLAIPPEKTFCRVPFARRIHRSVVFSRTLTASAAPSGESAGYWNRPCQAESTGETWPLRVTQTRSDAPRETGSIE